jgi:hypothetical protein
MRDRAIVLFLIVLQVVAMATQIHAPIVALFTIALASWAMLGTWQSMGAVVLEGNTETASSRKNADSNWHLVRRLVLGTSAGRRAVLCLLLVVVPAIRLAMKWFDPQQSTIGIMCELMLPAFVICQGILVWMLVRERNPGRGRLPVRRLSFCWCTGNLRLGPLRDCLRVLERLRALPCLPIV